MKSRFSSKGSRGPRRLCLLFLLVVTLRSPATLVDPCQDDPAFLTADGLPCGTTASPNICEVDSKALAACEVSCGTCQPCAESLPLPGIDVIVQVVALSNTSASVYVLSSRSISGAQFTSVCTSENQEVFVDVRSEISIINPFPVTMGLDGTFIGFSLAGKLVPPGYNLLFFLTIDDLAERGCDPGSYGLREGLLTDAEGNLIEFDRICGTLDQPCALFSSDKGSPSPPPALPLAASQVKSDPHFIGLRGQRFDVTGVAGRIYSILADEQLHINARFSPAFTTGMFIDPDTTRVLKMRPRGTWMSQVACVIGAEGEEEELTLEVSVWPAAADSADPALDCSLKPEDCLRDGSVVLNGSEELRLVGAVRPAAADLTIAVGNRKSCSFARITGPGMDIEIDVVPPPKEWSTRSPEYSHLNIKIGSVELSPRVSGVLGDTARIKFDEAGSPIMTAIDEDGAGILDCPVASYQVGSLLSTASPLGEGQAAQEHS